MPIYARAIESAVGARLESKDVEALDAILGRLIGEGLTLARE